MYTVVPQICPKMLYFALTVKMGLHRLYVFALLCLIIATCSTSQSGMFNDCNLLTFHCNVLPALTLCCKIRSYCVTYPSHSVRRTWLWESDRNAIYAYQHWDGNLLYRSVVAPILYWDQNANSYYFIPINQFWERNFHYGNRNIGKPFPYWDRDTNSFYYRSIYQLWEGNFHCRNNELECHHSKSHYSACCYCVYKSCCVTFDNMYSCLQVLKKIRWVAMLFQYNAKHESYCSLCISSSLSIDQCMRWNFYFSVDCSSACRHSS